MIVMQYGIVLLLIVVLEFAAAIAAFVFRGVLVSKSFASSVLMPQS